MEIKKLNLGLITTFLIYVNSFGQIILPIELIGEDGFTKSVTVNVPDPTKVKGLWMLINNLSYETKASVKINNGQWIPLNNNTVDVPEPAKSYGGIGGGYHMGSMKITLPITTTGVIIAGNNTLSFRFNQTDGLSSGFRVVRFNLVDANGTKLMSASEFVEDNPNNWVQPIAGAAAAAAGKVLWETKNITEGPSSSVVLRAKCGDCHAKNGRDLKYFNYSNHSIIERSKFHKLTQLEGEQIASYIRSLDVPNPGRPWNPPYQPGPGLDSKPVNEWAAGAGIDWVLEKDEMGFSFLFPNGIDTSAISLNKVLNVREMPVMLQFPDWNHWLPMIHPYDATFGGDNFINSVANKRYNGEGTVTGVRNITEYLERGPAATLPWGPLYRTQEGLLNDLDAFKSGEVEFLKPINEDLFAPGGVVHWSKYHADAVYSMKLWTVSKQWELIHGNDLEGMGKIFHGEKAEERSWPSLYRHVYDASPHLAKVPREDFTSHNGKKINQIYLSNVWYHIQPVLNSGNNGAGGFSVVDWQYTHGNLNDLRKGGANISVGEPGRMVLNYVKQMQQKHARGIGPEDAWNGWDLSRDHTLYSMVFWDSYNVWDRTDPTLKRQIMEALLWVWYKKSVSYSPSQYQRQVGGDYPIEPATVVPQNKVNGGNSADQIFTMIPLFRAEGVDCQLLNNIAGLGKGLWPLGAWHTLTTTCPVNSNPNITITAPFNARTYNTNTFKVETNVNVASGSIQKVEFYSNYSLVGTDLTEPFSYDFTNMLAGSYYIVAKAYTQTGKTAADTRLVVVNELGVVSNIDDTNKEIDFKTISIYPNPAKTELFVSGNYLENMTYQIFSIDGKDLQNGNLNGSISIQNLKSGIYLIKLKSESNVKVIRFIKE